MALFLAAQAATRSPLGRALDAATLCPRGDGNEIVVCKRSPSERYRIPAELRDPGFDFQREDVDSVSRARHRLLEGGASGIGSCSASGAGGATGCLVQKFRAWEQQKAGH